MVLLLAELVLAPMVAAIVAMLEGLLTLVGLLFELSWWGYRRRQRRAEPLQRPREPSLLHLRARRALAGVLVVSLMVALAAQLFFFESIVRGVLAKVEARTAIRVEFDSASGNLFTGRIVLANARIVRTQHRTSIFDVRIRELELDVALLSSMSATKRFDRVAIVDATGTFDRLARADPLRPRTPYEVDDLVLANVALEYRDHTGKHEVAMPIVVKRGRTQPFRSGWAPFDVMFRSNAELAIDGAPLRIETEVVEGGRRTRWLGRNLPLSVAGAWIGGPFAWVTAGTLDLDVADRWAIEGPAEIEMDWKLDLRDIRAEVPADAGALTRKLAGPVVAFASKHADHLPLHFSLRMNENEFEGHSSLAAAGLWQAVAGAATNALAERAGVPGETVRALGKRGLDGVKKLLDRRRRGK